MAKRRRDPEQDAREAVEIASQFDPETAATIERGRAAWTSIQDNSKRTLDEWWSVAEAVDAARQGIIRAKGFNSTRSGGYSRLMSAWLRQENLHTIDTGELKRLQHCLDHRQEIEQWMRDHVPEKKRRHWNSPNTIWPAYERFTKRKDPLSVDRRTGRQQEIIEKLERELGDAQAHIAELEQRADKLESELDWRNAAPPPVQLEALLALPSPSMIRVAELEAENAELRKLVDHHRGPDSERALKLRRWEDWDAARRDEENTVMLRQYIGDSEPEETWHRDEDAALEQVRAFAIEVWWGFNGTEPPTNPPWRVFQEVFDDLLKESWYQIIARADEGGDQRISLA